eukprot:5996253-Pyramimonas_sp.AAC.1
MCSAFMRSTTCISSSAALSSKPHAACERAPPLGQIPKGFRKDSVTDSREERPFPMTNSDIEI